MGTKPTAIISCFGIFGLLISCLLGEKSNTAKYYQKQSVNCMLSTIIVSFITIVLGGMLDGFIAKILLLAGAIYGIILFLQILYSAVTLKKIAIWGLVRIV